jgi:pSer/pThr/pTyr-binding forkhead associated (FHA) protein
MVSRKHAVVEFHDNAYVTPFLQYFCNILRRYYYKDLGGLNGSQINEFMVGSCVGVRLNAGDVIVIGSTTFICMEVDERCVCG